MNIKMLLMPFVAISLVGCAGLTYQEPRNQADAATIQGHTERKSLSQWTATQIATIDNGSVGMKWSSKSKIKLTPGTHTVVARVQFNRGGFFGEGPQLANIAIPFNAESNQHYVVKGMPQDATAQAWVETLSGKRVTENFSSSYAPIPQQRTTVVYTGKA